MNSSQVYHPQSPQLEHAKAFAEGARVAKGLGPTPRPCRRCGQLLTDPRSIARGIGDDCAKQEQAETHLVQTFTNGRRVRIVTGTDAGKAGIVKRVRLGKPYPVVVALDGRLWSDMRYQAESLELVEDEPLARYDRVRIISDGLAGRVGTITDEVGEDEAGEDEAGEDEAGMSSSIPTGAIGTAMAQVRPTRSEPRTS